MMKIMKASILVLPLSKGIIQLDLTVSVDNSFLLTKSTRSHTKTTFLQTS